MTNQHERPTKTGRFTTTPLSRSRGIQDTGKPTHATLPRSPYIRFRIRKHLRSAACNEELEKKMQQLQRTYRPAKTSRSTRNDVNTYVILRIMTTLDWKRTTNKRLLPLPGYPLNLETQHNIDIKLNKTYLPKTTLYCTEQHPTINLQQ